VPEQFYCKPNGSLTPLPVSLVIQVRCIFNTGCGKLTEEKSLTSEADGDWGCNESQLISCTVQYTRNQMFDILPKPYHFHFALLWNEIATRQVDHGPNHVLAVPPVQPTFLISKWKKRSQCLSTSEERGDENVVCLHKGYQKIAMISSLGLSTPARDYRHAL
jgi:hypothetical protein